MVDLLSPTHDWLQAVTAFPAATSITIRREQQKRRLYCFPWVCCYSFFSFAHLSYTAWIDCLSAVTRAARQGNSIPSYSSQLLCTAHSHPAQPTIEFGSLHCAPSLENPVSPSHCPTWTHCGCTSADDPGTTLTVFAVHLLFASHSTRTLPRAVNLGGQ